MKSRRPFCLFYVCVFIFERICVRTRNDLMCDCIYVYLGWGCNPRIMTLDLYLSGLVSIVIKQAVSACGGTTEKIEQRWQLCERHPRMCNDYQKYENEKSTALADRGKRETDRRLGALLESACPEKKRKKGKEGTNKRIFFFWHLLSRLHFYPKTMLTAWALNFYEKDARTWWVACMLLWTLRCVHGASAVCSIQLVGQIPASASWSNLK